MKLRIKLTLFSILLIVIAVALCCTMILTFVQNRDMQAVVDTGLTDYLDFYYSALRTIPYPLPEQAALKRSYIVHAFRSLPGFREFTLRQGNDYLCNNIGFDIERLFQSDVSESDSRDIIMQYRIVRVAKTDYLIVHAEYPNAEQYDLSFARNITAVTDGVRALAVRCLTVGLIVALGTSIEGMTVTWDNAVQVCKDFFAVGGVTDMTVSEAFQLEKNGNYAYRFNFVREIAGVPLAINHETTAYKGVETPWDYESVYMIVDKAGLYDVGWGSPTKTTEIVNPAAAAMPFSEIQEIFETMVVEFYKTESVRYDGYQWDYSVTVDNILLSLLRIRDVSTEERVGLYVPAWVFYGQCSIDDEPTANWTPRIVFAINALDGTVINMEQGY